MTSPNLPEPAASEETDAAPEKLRAPGVCGKDDCSNYPGYQWQRWATPEEIEMYHLSGDLPLSETSAHIPVYACDDHVIDESLRAAVHEATCLAPNAECECVL